MADIFEPVIRQFFETGFGNILVFMLTLALFFALTRKSKVLGENVVINGIVSAIAAFLVSFWIPIFTSFSFVTALSPFFVQSTAILLFLLIAFLAASMFYPDFPKFLGEAFQKRTTLYVFIALGIGLFVTSGLVSSFWQAIPAAKPGTPTPPSEILLIAAGLIIFVIILLVGSSVALGGENGG